MYNFFFSVNISPKFLINVSFYFTFIFRKLKWDWSKRKICLQILNTAKKASSYSHSCFTFILGSIQNNYKDLILKREHQALVRQFMCWKGYL